MRRDKDFQEPEEQPKRPWRKIISIGLLVVLGVGLGYVAISQEFLSLFQVIECVFVLGISVICSLIFREMGHCFGGVISGYRFGYFRVLGRAICPGREEKEEKRFVMRKFREKGKWVSCFMMPPRGVPYLDIPYKAYLNGGAVANFVSIALACLYLIPFMEQWYVVAIFSVVSLVQGARELIPRCVAGEANSAFLRRAIDDSHDSHSSFVNHLCVMGAYARGQSIGDMPEAWFLGKLSISAGMTDEPLVAELWCDTADRFLIRGEIFQAKIIYEAIYHQEELNLVLRLRGLHCLLYSMLLEGRVEQVKIYDIPYFLQKEGKKLEAYYLPFSRYRYAHGKFVMDNTRTRNLALANFNRVAEGYPFFGEVDDHHTMLSRLDDVELHYGLWGV